MLPVPNLQTHPMLLNVFRFISPIYFKFLMWGAIVAASCMVIGILPFWALLYNSIIYTSLLILFPTFLSFQWDIMLIEVAIFSLFLISPKILVVSPKQRYFLHWIQLIPIISLIIRLFYHSAIVKVLSNDSLWLSLTALDTHLFSQPLPHFLSYYVHSFIISNNLSVPFLWVMFLVEFLLPFALLLPAYRKIAAFVLIIFQFTIIFTGNYGFFNFLTITVLLMPLFITEQDAHYELSQSYKFLTLPILAIVCINSIFMIPKPHHSLPIAQSIFKKLLICNQYGLFARMTRNQTGFRLFVAKTPGVWVPVKLHYFDRWGYPTLSFVHPYHPRIRWQLWFKFLNVRNYPSWYYNFLRLIAKDPSRLSSIVQSGRYPKENNYVKMCYDNIIFDQDLAFKFDAIYYRCFVHFGSSLYGLVLKPVYFYLRGAKKIIFIDYANSNGELLNR